MIVKNYNHIFETMEKDIRINVWHLALILAILRLADLQNNFSTIRVSRSVLMKLSHIRTFPTYHKYFKELQEFGYITYSPSYHPGFKSTITLNIVK
ncbi:hypothetical protein SAMN05421741_12323 [Paenimyroides ummariense]|uniref:Winged helix DNA-binding domain-containing protein n=1 Tax=Paenimyroides ummariense TaxID=913024 RepID=A0A1I5EYH4_9FLAO|nr:hypothetical protein SAMN05421741_12323 [Paenimyroides ummariense]